MPAKKENRMRKEFEEKDIHQEVRLNKYLSEAGVCSRREADRLIEEGKVFVDGVRAERQEGNGRDGDHRQRKTMQQRAENGSAGVSQTRGRSLHDGQTLERCDRGGCASVSDTRFFGWKAG